MSTFSETGRDLLNEIAFSVTDFLDQLVKNPFVCLNRTNCQRILATR